MWLARKLSILRSQDLKFKSSKAVKEVRPSRSFSLSVLSTKTEVDKLVPLVVGVFGASKVGKTTLIRSISKEGGFQDVAVRSPVILTEFDSSVIQAGSIQGALVCYDTTNRDSMDCLPEILNVMASQSIPCYLIGLKSDMTSKRQVNWQLAQDLAQLFSIELYEVQLSTSQGIDTARNIYDRFVRYCANECNKRLVSKRAPATKRLSMLPAPEPSFSTPQQRSIPKRQPSISKRNSSSNNNNRVSLQRLSRNSSGTMSLVALSVHDILDDILLPDSAPTTSIHYFIVFFRKFMRPRDLATILFERFERDCSSSSSEPSDIPTQQQERIRSMLCFWLSHYWCDFHSHQTRQIMQQFLCRLSSRSELRAMCDVLIPLVSRDPPIRDPDAGWALTDQDDDIRPNRNLKKDSGYSDAFRWPSRAVFGMMTDQLPPTSLDEYTACFLTQVSVTTMAEQLTWVEAQLFRKLEPRDFLRYLWSNARNALVISEWHSNFVATWTYVMCTSPFRIAGRAAAVVEKLLCIAEKLCELRNYNTLAAVLVGLQKSNAMYKACDRDIACKRYEALEEELERSHDEWRSEKPMIPHLTYCKSVLSSLDNESNDVVCWDKFASMGDCIERILQLQYPGYFMLEPNPDVLTFIASGRKWVDKSIIPE